MATAPEPTVSKAVGATALRGGSWIDRLIAWLDGLPGPTWLTFLVLAAMGLLAGNAVGWLDGKPLTLDPYNSVFGLFPVAELVLIRHLDRVASEALVTFRPLMGRSDDGFHELQRRLTSTPGVGTAVFTVIWVALGLTSDVADPTAHRLVGASSSSVVLILVIEIVINGLNGVFLLKALRHFLDVARIHREAPRIDLFEPAPLYAFSRLTSQTALGLLFLLAVLAPSLAPTHFTAAGAADSTRLGFLTLIVLLVTSATGMFVLPLYGMHRRIVAEKERLQGANGARLSAVLGELERDVRLGELARADGLNKQLTSVLAERDLLGKLPTWPWQAATLRAFVSALLLPVLVYVLARAAERVVL